MPTLSRIAATGAIWRVVDELKSQGPRQGVRVFVGGAAGDEDVARDAGADAYYRTPFEVLAAIREHEETVRSSEVEHLAEADGVREDVATRGGGDGS